MNNARIIKISTQMKILRPQKIPTVLSIGGFDNIGGAGIQADLKTTSELGCHGMNVLTALPIQNSLAVRSIYPISSSLVKMQLDTVLEDIYPDVIKIGMLHSVANIKVVAEVLKDYSGDIVIDPVLKSTSGTKLYRGNFKAALRDRLFPLASLITPNIPEVYDLIGQTVSDAESMYEAGIELLRSGAGAILIKGGHLKSNTMFSSLVTADRQAMIYNNTRIETKNTRGTGCTLATAIACYLAMGKPLNLAFPLAMDYVASRIRASVTANLGKGNGCLAPSAKKRH
ncbi:MAG: bifunctional hydroxymethylpyrimidine kinase/phosphomethylpyrimidine kinase [Sphingobacterium sp.]|uniref:bifunctional hydroxymethylpyrimidine kinase/phosphomethylpyrimidine kinase n=1 Tax=Sphingobacterium sp. JB170 TaxID=1434842 RepID=UPI000B35FF33|nr:bifunctional hydroxymethylpyrimidine kinase/phosphomethylpyrimidine kinase [Sphingobacterium sp. JB170]